MNKVFNSEGGSFANNFFVGLRRRSPVPSDKIDPRDDRVDVRAKFALARMRDKRPDMAPDAIRLIQAVNSGQLAGIYGDDLQRTVQLAKRVGTVRWKLVPEKEDATLALESANPSQLPPTIIFRGDTPDISQSPPRIDAALQKVSHFFHLWQTGELGRCNHASPGERAVAVTPPGYCIVRKRRPLDNSIKLIPHRLLHYVWSFPRHLRTKPPALQDTQEVGSFSELNPDQCIDFDDDRKPVFATLTVPFRFICSLCVDFGGRDNKSTAIGTGILVSPKHVLTAGHVVSMLIPKSGTSWGVGPLAKRTLVVPSRNHAARSSINRRPLGVLRAQAIHISGSLDEARRQARLITDTEVVQFDYALVTLERSVNPKTFGFWGTFGSELREIAPSEIKDKEITIAGYPGDKCLLTPGQGSATSEMLQNCYVRTSPPHCTEEISCQCLSDVASTQWRTNGKVVNPSPSISFSAPLAFILEGSVCGGMSGSPIWIQRNGKFVLVGMWWGWFSQLPIALGTRIHEVMLRELREWMRIDGIEPNF